MSCLQTHTRDTQTQTCIDQRNVKTEYAEPQTIRLEVFIYEPEVEVCFFTAFWSFQKDLFIFIYISLYLNIYSQLVQIPLKMYMCVFQLNLKIQTSTFFFLLSSLLLLAYRYISLSLIPAAI